MPQGGEPGGVDARLVSIERRDVIPGSFIQREREVCPVPAEAVKRVGQVRRALDREAQAAPQRRVGGAHVVTDGVQPRRDRGSSHHEPAQRVVQAPMGKTGLVGSSTSSQAA